MIGCFDASNPREQINLQGVSAIHNMFDLLSDHTTQLLADLLIDTGDGATILLQNVDLGDLTHSHFIF